MALLLFLVAVALALQKKPAAIVTPSEFRPAVAPLGVQSLLTPAENAHITAAATKPASLAQLTPAQRDQLTNPFRAQWLAFAFEANGIGPNAGVENPSVFDLVNKVYPKRPLRVRDLDIANSKDRLRRFTDNKYLAPLWDRYHFKTESWGRYSLLPQPLYREFVDLTGKPLLQSRLQYAEEGSFYG